MNTRKAIGTIIFWLTYPVIYLLLLDTHRTRVIIEANSEVLFEYKWLGDKKLSLPGGGIKKNENSKKAAVREVLEETGIKLDLSQLKLLVKNLKVYETGFRYFVDCYYISLPKKVIANSDNLEILSSNWYKPKKIIDSKKATKTTIMLIQTWLDTKHLIN